jgi:hypothetical protein
MLAKWRILQATAGFGSDRHPQFADCSVVIGPNVARFLVNPDAVLGRPDRNRTHEQQVR